MWNDDSTIGIRNRSFIVIITTTIYKIHSIRLGSLGNIVTNFLTL